MTSIATDQPEANFPPPPREVTSAIRSRARSEPRVRFWLLAGLVLVLAGIYFAVRDFRALRRQIWVSQHGVEVEATVNSVAGNPTPGKSVPPTSPVGLDFDWKEKRYRVQGVLEGRESWVETKQKVTIKIDPEDPMYWTARMTPPAWSPRYFLTSITVFAVAGALLVLAKMMAGRVVRLWRDGSAAVATVVSTQQTALAPKSRAARVTLDGQTGSAVSTVYLPRTPEQGEPIWVLLRPNGTVGAAAEWFEA